MGERQRARCRLQQIDRLTERPPAEPILQSVGKLDVQRAPLKPLEHDVRRPDPLWGHSGAHVEGLDYARRGSRQPVKQAPFSQKAGEKTFALFAQKRFRHAQAFDRDIFLEAEVPRPVDHAEAPLTDDTFDAVLALNRVARPAKGIRRAGVTHPSTGVGNTRVAFMRGPRSLAPSRPATKAATRVPKGARPLGNLPDAALNSRTKATCSEVSSQSC